MKVTETRLDGVLIIEPRVFGDSRGCFLETYQAERYAAVGITLPFVQDNISRSERGVMRGLHFQIKQPQGKLVSCIKGAVFDVAVDIRPKSPTFGDHVAVELTEWNRKQLWIPPGFAHGFCTLTDVADFSYKCTAFYDPEDEGGIAWNDQGLAIDWPIARPLVSEKDRNWPPLSVYQGSPR